VAAFLAVTAPSACVIMCVDHFLLPRIYKISRPLLKVPSWGETSIGNWPAIIALAIAVVFGAWATGIFPGENPDRYWGPAPLLGWILAGVLYLAFVGLARAAVPAVPALKSVLGFSSVVTDEPLPSSAIVDIATLSENGGQPTPRTPVLAGAADGS
jgi:hypothetical protein